MADNRDQNAKFQIKQGQLVISIGLDSLKRSIEHDTDLIVSEPNKAVFEIKHEISFEEQDGRTPFHQMIANAAYRAYENGAEGLEEQEI